MEQQLTVRRAELQARSAALDEERSKLIAQRRALDTAQSDASATLVQAERARAEAERQRADVVAVKSGTWSRGTSTRSVLRILGEPKQVTLA